MKCNVCGAESGKYPLCRGCNLKRERGEIVKCSICNTWHYASVACPVDSPVSSDGNYLYDAKHTLMSKAEQEFYHAIFISLPQGYHVFPQVNLATFIFRTDNVRYHNELFRNVDFLVTDSAYCPKFVIEINDQTHLSYDRKERDEKVRKICEEAGIPILKLWTSYGVNVDYIKGRIDAYLNEPSHLRVHHFSTPSVKTPSPIENTYPQPPSYTPPSRKGCYVATCVYGSYDCPPVWVLRRYRDVVLSNSWIGRIFVRVYYALSPLLVKWFGKKLWFVSFNRTVLDKLVSLLQAKGFSDSKYVD